MRDLGILATRLIEDFPEFYSLFAETEFGFDGRAPANRFNRNPLLKLNIGADGLKTGHTREAGYGLTGSAKQGDRRIVFVLSGLNSPEARAQESEAMVNWAFRQFAEREVVRKDKQLAQVDVWMGEASSVALVPARDISMLLPTLAGDKIEAEVVYDSPVQAPIIAGQVLGELVIRPEGLAEQRFDLVADSSVAPGGFLKRIGTAARLLLDQINSQPEAPS
jgi:D-alanyl-D-alanine carboxypeptidase (penicillin-binding protein 5/6)